jgi:hypothetical protein
MDFTFRFVAFMLAAMKRPVLASLILFALSMPVRAVDGPKEDDFLIFDKIEEDQRATPALPLPAPEPSAPASARKLPGALTASIRTVLLDVPDKSFASARLSTLKAEAVQQGTQAQPVIVFESATVSLQAALEKASAWVVAGNEKFPDGVTLKVSAQGGYGAHEHDSAGAASAILLDAIGNGRTLDPEIVIIGGVNEKGHVTAAGRLATRLRTLETDPPPPAIGVPMVSEVEVRDLALMDEMEVLARQQIISLVSLDDAQAIAAKDKPERVAKAFALFASVREAAAKTPIKVLLKSPKFLQRLQEITTAMPNHLSAKLLLLAAGNKVPGRITFATSRQAILKAIKPFVNVSSTNRPPKEIQLAATEGGNVLLRMQPKVHPAVERYLVSMKAYLRAVNNYLDIPPNDSRANKMRAAAMADINKKLADVELEKGKLDKQEVQLQ